MEKIGLLGPLGTFTEEAVAKYCSENCSECERVPYRTVTDVFNAVRDNSVSKGVVPIENFLHGHVLETLDNLNKNDIKIQAALVLPICQCLIGCSEVENVKTVKSHPQALAQCSDYLDANYSDAVRVDVASTASAVKEISEGDDKHSVAIGSRVSAERYGLKVLAEEIGNNNDNKTMFVVIGKGAPEKGERSRTSLSISPMVNQPGVLRSILNDFADEDIDLKSVQSRPDGQGNYIFYIDIEGNADDENLKLILDKIGKDSVIKILGSYPYVSFSEL